MKLKTFMVVVILSVAVIAQIHAFGLGAQVNFSTGDLLAPGFSVVVSPTDITHLAVNWYLDFEKVNIVGLTFDACPLALPLNSSSAVLFNFTLGVGIFANIVFVSDTGVTGGLRIPVGFNVLLGQKAFEIYAHVAPSFGVNFLPSLEFSKPFYPIAVGARLWFR